MSKISTIFLIVETPFRERDLSRFGISILGTQFDVRVIDCTQWLRPDYWARYSEDRYKFQGYTSVENWTEFIAQFNVAPNYSIVIDYLLDRRGWNNDIRQWLRSNKYPMVVVFTGVIPNYKFRGWALIRNKIGRVRDASIILTHRLQRAFPFYNPPVLLADIAILSGKASLRKLRANAPEKIWAHSFDYDKFLALRDESSGESGYAVFLDQNLVYHPDLLITGSIQCTTAHEYFPALNHFFDNFEKITGLRVVIAAQPKADYSLHPNLFNEREVVYGKTAELVRDSELVFAHYSTAISFAVLWIKPVVILTSNSILLSWAMPYIRGFRDALGAHLVNINTCNLGDNLIKDWKEVSVIAYYEYKVKYIKTPSSLDRPIWEQFVEYLNERFK